MKGNFIYTKELTLSLFLQSKLIAWTTIPSDGMAFKVLIWTIDSFSKNYNFHRQKHKNVSNCGMLYPPPYIQLRILCHDNYSTCSSYSYIVYAPPLAICYNVFIYILVMPSSYVQTIWLCERLCERH